MKQPNTIAAAGFGILFIALIGFSLVHEKEKTQEKPKSYTYVKDVEPIVKTYCLSCHCSEDDNPSELYLDAYESLMKGGKHGVPVVAGKPDESSMYFKLLPDPPFGRQMPRGRKKITPAAVQVIHDWIQQGALKE